MYFWGDGAVQVFKVSPFDKSATEAQKLTLLFPLGREEQVQDWSNIKQWTHGGYLKKGRPCKWKLYGKGKRLIFILMLLFNIIQLFVNHIIKDCEPQSETHRIMIGFM